ncbi:MAG: ferredoxin reductase domain-containing protein [Myxococcales bacterium]
MPEAPRFHRTPVVEAWDETPSLRGLRLRLPPDLAERHVAPGQVVQIRPPGGEQPGFFALASPPAAGERAELLIKRGGRVANSVIEAAQAGAELEATEPSGAGFPAEAARQRDVLLFATGSGITAIRALIHHLLAERAAAGRLRLFYGQRDPADFAYANEWEDWRRAGLSLTRVCSQPGPGWNGPTGYVQDVAAAAAFGGAAPERAVAYLSGVPGMLAGAREALSRFGVTEDRIFENH